MRPEETVNRPLKRRAAGGFGICREQFHKQKTRKTHPLLYSCLICFKCLKLSLSAQSTEAEKRPPGILVNVSIARSSGGGEGKEGKCSFRKLQIFISQTTDPHFANYRFSFRKLQIFISFRLISFLSISFRPISFRKLQ